MASGSEAIVHQELAESIRVDVAQTLEDFRLLEGVSRLGVGVSGGADSLTLLKVLVDLESDVEIVPIFIRQYKTQSVKSLSAVIGKEVDLTLEVVERDSSTAAAKQLELGKAPCRACAPIRARAIAQAARDMSLDAVALGHHLNDASATLLMNIFHRGKAETFLPKTKRATGNVAIIRPLYFVDERLVKEFSPCGPAGIFSCGMCSIHSSERRRTEQFVEEALLLHGRAAFENVRQLLRTLAEDAAG